jgi:hypothetical protein
LALRHGQDIVDRGSGVALPLNLPAPKIARQPKFGKTYKKADGVAADVAGGDRKKASMSIVVECEKAKAFELQADVDNGIDQLPSCNISARVPGDNSADSDEMSDLSSCDDKYLYSQHNEYECCNRSLQRAF